jgi:hypothetical protein
MYRQVSQKTNMLATSHSHSMLNPPSSTSSKLKLESSSPGFQHPIRKVCCKSRNETALERRHSDPCCEHTRVPHARARNRPLPSFSLRRSVSPSLPLSVPRHPPFDHHLTQIDPHSAGGPARGPAGQGGPPDGVPGPAQPARFDQFCPARPGPPAHLTTFDSFSRRPARPSRPCAGGTARPF